jgi:hypothetical protein
VSIFLATTVVLVAMVATMVVAGLVVAYVAFISQGKDIPRAEWLTGALRRLVQRWHVPTEPAESSDPELRLHVYQGGIRQRPPH